MQELECKLTQKSYVEIQMSENISSTGYSKHPDVVYPTTKRKILNHEEIIDLNALSSTTRNGIIWISHGGRQMCHINSFDFDSIPIWDRIEHIVVIQIDINSAATCY